MTALPDVTLHEPRKVFDKAQPIFIVGCVRSGTSAMMKSLREGAKIKGFNEGNVAQLLRNLLQTVWKHYRAFPEAYLTNGRHMVSKVEQKYMENHIINWFGEIFMEQMGEGMWLDKTPEGGTMIRTCPILLQMFPKAKFIFCKRRAIENILSRQRKFAGAPFVSYCSHWADSMQAWLEVRDKLKGHFIEADQRDMAIASREMADQMKRLLGLADEQTEGVYETLSSKRVEQTRAAQDELYVDIEDTGWTDEEKQQFMEICMPMMRAFGYSEQAQTSASASPVRLFVPVRSTGVIERVNVNDAPWGFCETAPHTLQLHPNPPGKPRAEIRYLNVQFKGHDHFRARLVLENEKSQPVEYHFRIEHPGTGKEIVSSRQVISVSSPMDWKVEFPALTGNYDVIIGTQMATASTSADSAWARWQDAMVA